MPFRPLNDRERSRAVIEIHGPRTRKEQLALRAELNRLLKKHNAKLKQRPPTGRG